MSNEFLPGDRLKVTYICPRKHGEGVEGIDRQWCKPCFAETGEFLPLEYHTVLIATGAPVRQKMGYVVDELMTDDERKCWDSVRHAAGDVLALPVQHPMEREEVCHAFHQIQDYLMSRPGLRLMYEATEEGAM